MKIVGIQYHKDKAHQQLMKYILSLFNPDYVWPYGLNVIHWGKPPSLLIINDDKTISEGAHLQIKKHNTPIFLINATNNPFSNVCARFNIKNLKFDNKEDLTNVKKRLELIKTIQKIEYEILNFRSDKFSCGINRPKYYVGDSIGY
jgi:hypothetical protein